MIETLMCVVIIAVLVSLAAPQLRGALTRQRLNGVRDELTTSMHTARSEAMRRGVTVTLQRRTDCAGPLANKDDWSCGWIQLAGDEHAEPAATTTGDVQQSFEVPSGLQLVHQGGGEVMQFAATGQPLLVAGKFIVAPKSAGIAPPEALRMTTTLCINRTGRIRAVEGKTLC